MFKPIPEVKVQLMVMKELAFDSRVEAWPWVHQRSMLQQLVGSSCIVVLDHEVAKQHLDVTAWLKEAHHSALSKEFVVVLEPGDSVYLPLGSHPLIVPLPSDPDTAEMSLMPKKEPPPAKKKKIQSTENQFMSLVVHLPFDQEFDVSCSASACQFASASYVKAINYIAKSVRDAVVPWRAAVEARAGKRDEAVAADGE